MNKSKLLAFEQSLNKYNLNLDKYTLPSLNVYKASSSSRQESVGVTSTPVEPDVEPPNPHLAKLFAFQHQLDKEEPGIYTWYYMDKNEVTNLLRLKSRKKIRKVIGDKINDKYPKGINRIVLTELLYSVTKFCIMSQFTVDQSGSCLSIFYITHRYFTGNFNMTPKEVYDYFVELMMKHCIDYPPDSIKIYNKEESRKLLLYFCTLYLRFLPLIRLVTMPNIGFSFDYELEPEPPKEKKGKKDKKDKKGKKKKK